jgi:hypothetical protein
MFAVIISRHAQYLCKLLERRAEPFQVVVSHYLYIVDVWKVVHHIVQELVFFQRQVSALEYAV